MSRLEQLINNLCPHGVEYRDLGDTNIDKEIPLPRRGGMEPKRHDGVVVSKSKVEEDGADGVDGVKTTPPLSAAPLRRRGIGMEA